MNKTKCLAGKIGLVVCSALLGCTSYGQQAVSVGVGAPLPSVEVRLPGVEIRAESDFYEPLTPYGRWEVVGSYGRCWIPGGVEADWRPYSEGYWQSTDAGWYWTSDEPWAWATYHYGRWDSSPQFGWYWVPQTQWAPAWVSWHSGEGYIGWAPLYPSGVAIISPKAYVFVEERHFMEPVRRSTVVVVNTTIINKTIIHEAPVTATIEKVTGQKVQAVKVQEVRRSEEAPVVARQHAPASASEKKVQAPVRNESGSGEKKAVAVVPNANKEPVKQEKSIQPLDKQEQQPAREKQAVIEKNPLNAANKDHEDKPKE